MPVRLLLTDAACALIESALVGILSQARNPGLSDQIFIEAFLY